jgi:hypothetical protein
MSAQMKELEATILPPRARRWRRSFEQGQQHLAKMRELVSAPVRSSRGRTNLPAKAWRWLA